MSASAHGKMIRVRYKTWILVHVNSFLDQVSLYNSGSLVPHYVDQAILESIESTGIRGVPYHIWLEISLLACLFGVLFNLLSSQNEAH